MPPVVTEVVSLVADRIITAEVELRCYSCQQKIEAGQQARKILGRSTGLDRPYTLYLCLCCPIPEVVKILIMK
jgi:hypothetical protein